jgi:hypothetical protein
MRKVAVISCAMAALLGAPSVWAQPAQPPCSDRNISATGTPTLLYFTGKRAARLAWSAKVHSELGEAYASWGRVKDGHIDCVRSPGRFLCSASGFPCRSPFAS